MTINLDGSSPKTADDNKPVTFDEAEDLGAFELASWWADRPSWPLLHRSASDELAELACMSALVRWLTRWQPIHLHKAVLAGAEPAAVAAAFGGSVDDAFGCWREWATRQREILVFGKPGVTADDYATVTRVFVAARVTGFDEEAP